MFYIFMTGIAFIQQEYKVWKWENKIQKLYDFFWN